MQRFLTAISAAALLASVATAQCFESNFGTQIGLGDDVAFPSATTATAFAMPGFLMGATTYTHFTVNTNGCVFPTTAATGVVGATATGYSTTPATQLTNLRGAAGGVPRIAPLWRDLDLLAANNGGLWVNNLPNKCVITWANAVQWNTAGPVFTFQAQLFPNGDVTFFYNGAVVSTGATIAGISQGGGIASVPGFDLSVGPNISATYLHYEQFAANTFDLQTTSLSFINTGTGYVQTAGPCVPANNSSAGVGCYAAPGTGVYETFADAAVASAALQGNALQLVPTGSGYTGVWLVGGASAYIAPTGGATSLVAADDGVQTVTLPSSFPTSYGPVTQISVASNGIIGLGPNGNPGADFNLTGPEFAASLANAFFSWHDYNPAEVGSGAIKTELVGPLFCVTWDGVENYSAPAALNPGTIQFQLNLATGAVTMVWSVVNTDITSTFGSSHLVGWKAGGAVTDPGTQVLATTPLANQGDLRPMEISVAPAPIIGTTITYTTSNIAENVPGSGLFIGLNVISVGANPGVDLGIIGAPGCNFYLNSLDLLTALVGLSPIQTNSFTIPIGAPIGFQLFSQSVSLFAPNSLPNGQNAFGLTSSNYVTSTLNTF